MGTWTEVAPDVYRLSLSETNCYLVVDAEGMTLVDAGLPRTRGIFAQLLQHLGATPGAVDAVVLTHGHFDHVGLARRLQQEHGTRVWVHPRDANLARHPYRYRHEAARLPYLVRYPQALPVLAGMTLNGALAVRGVDATPEMHHGHALDVPGRPIVLWTPGHTDGHCSLEFPEHGVLISGDALVTRDPYTGAEGPRIVAGAATADSDEALASLDVLRESDADVVLPGHGEPWTSGVEAAIAQARRAGRS